MADFSAVLKKTVDALKDNTPEARERVYQKARATIEAKLAAITPPPPQAVADRQIQLLNDAIASVEAAYAEPEPADVTIDDLDDVFAELNGETPKPDAPAAEPIAEQPVAETPQADALDEVAPAGERRLDAPAPSDAAAQPDGFVTGPEHGEPLPDEALPGKPARERPSPFVAGLVVFALLAAAIGAWYFKDDLARWSNFESDTQVATGGSETSGETGEGEAATAGETPQAESGGEPSRKFTQRLLPNGDEVDEGAAGGTPGLGEGTAVAQVTTPGGEAAESENAVATDTGEQGENPQAALPVGQKAIFYEEPTNAAQASAEEGVVVWSVVQESPGNDLPPEPAIRAEATVPAMNLQLKMTIRRNTDESLPASHVIEMIFLASDNFPGGGIDNILRIAMKRSEQDTGNPLLGIPAKIADGFFLLALSDRKADADTNTLLLGRQRWIDIAVGYKTGRRALITLEKGIPGDKIFNEVIAAWQNASSG